MRQSTMVWGRRYETPMGGYQWITSLPMACRWIPSAHLATLLEHKQHERAPYSDHRLLLDARPPESEGCEPVHTRRSHSLQWNVEQTAVATASTARAAPALSDSQRRPAAKRISEGRRPLNGARAKAKVELVPVAAERCRARFRDSGGARRERQQLR